MIKVEHGYTAEIVSQIKGQYKGKNLPDVDMYANSGAVSNLTIEDGCIREIISTDEGVFKDVTAKLSEVEKIVKKKDFAFINAKDFVFCVYLQGLTDTDFDLIKQEISRARKSSVKKQEKPNKAEVTKETREYYKKIKKNNNSQGRLPLAQRFRIPILFAIVGMMLSIINIVDPLNIILYQYANPRIFNILLRGIIGFFSGFIFVFYMIWFENHSDTKRIISIVLFPITSMIFAVIGLIGTIPYIIHLLICGSESYKLAGIIRVSVKIVAGLLVVLFLGMFSLFGYDLMELFI